jgi:hypothetical protein
MRRWHLSCAAPSSTPAAARAGWRYPPSTFDAEKAIAIIASVFQDVEAERWDGKFFPLSTRDEVRAYCQHNFIPAERAEQAEVPLWLTKRGVLVRARKP